MKELICIVCPKGCHLKAEQHDGEWKISGYSCPRGKEYGENEVSHPTRVVTSTVKIEGAALPRLPVKTSGPIPKEKIMEAMHLLDSVKMTAPVHCGDKILENICGTDVSFVATRDM